MTPPITSNAAVYHLNAATRIRARVCNFYVFTIRPLRSVGERRRYDVALLVISDEGL
jgi:hypothetical protein